MDYEFVHFFFRFIQPLFFNTYTGYTNIIYNVLVI